MNIIIATATAELSEKRSRFIAFVEPVRTEEDVKCCVSRIKKKYFDARHVCYAYRLGDDGELCRGVDDGEPSGTAGRPILGQLYAAGLTYTIVVVVRYFGGIKLGTGPLGVAYKTVAAEALKNASAAESIKPLLVKSMLELFAPFSETEIVERTARLCGTHIASRSYAADGVCYTLSIPRETFEQTKTTFEKIHTIRLITD